MSTVRPYLKSIAIIPEEYDNQICSTGFAVLTCKKEILPKYLFYLLFSDVVIRQCNEMMVGAHYPALRFDQVARIKIPLPPLEEQKRIVSRLELLISRAEEAKRLRKLAKEEAGKIMQAALNKVFSRAEEKGWKWVKLGEISKISAGGTPKRSIKEYWNGDIPWVKISDIPEDGLVLDTEEKITEEGLKNSSAKIFPRGTILFSIFATIAKVGILGIDAATNQAIAGIQIKDVQIIDRKYLFYCLKSFGFSLLTVGRGMAQRNINQTILKSLKIPFPSLEEQKRIIVYLDKLRETIESIRELQQKTEEELEKLVPSILDKAFRGEL